MAVPSNTGVFEILWVSLPSPTSGDKPVDPAFPTGRSIDLSEGRPITCDVTLTYPSPSYGHYRIDCMTCRRNTVIDVRGLPDDINLVKLPCHFNEPPKFMWDPSHTPMSEKEDNFSVTPNQIPDLLSKYRK